MKIVKYVFEVSFSFVQKWWLLCLCTQQSHYFSWRGCTCQHRKYLKMFPMVLKQCLNQTWLAFPKGFVMLKNYRTIQNSWLEENFLFVTTSWGSIFSHLPHFMHLSQLSLLELQDTSSCVCSNHNWRATSSHASWPMLGPKRKGLSLFLNSSYWGWVKLR